MKRIFFVTAGSVFFVLGALGLFLPVLPTTPFWLLTAYFYLNSSPVLYRRVMKLPLFGYHIRCFRQYRAIPLRGKVWSVVILWLTNLFSAWLIGRWWLTVLLLAIAAGVTIHILSYRTLTPEMESRLKSTCSEKETDFPKVR